jgi:hypothetical protein
MQYRRNSLIVEATQWYKNGDHPNDDVFRPFEDTGKVPDEPREGAVVRYYRHPEVLGSSLCPECHIKMGRHGWIDIFRDGHIVCPGDWIVSEIGNEGSGYYPVKPEIFEKTYEKV